MANPKRKTSKGRRDRRRAHDALTPVDTMVCPNCMEVKLPHRACQSCGYYNGREVISVDED
jgi:large subunit ribosomal protein L32